MSKATEKRNSVYNSQIGNTLRSLRLKTGQSQQDIANELGITYQQIQKYENGKSRIPAYIIPVLKEVFDTDYEALFEGTSEKGGNTPHRACADEIAKISYLLKETRDPDFLRKARFVVKTMIEEFTE